MLLCLGQVLEGSLFWKRILEFLHVWGWILECLLYSGLNSRIFTFFGDEFWNIYLFKDEFYIVYFLRMNSRMLIFSRMNSWTLTFSRMNSRLLLFWGRILECLWYSQNYSVHSRVRILEFEYQSQNSRFNGNLAALQQMSDLLPTQIIVNILKIISFKLWWTHFLNC